MIMTPIRFCALAALVLTLAATGCKSSGDKTQIPLTPSGFPEVILHSQTVDGVKVVAEEFFKGRGYTERESRHAYEFVFDKAEPGHANRALRVVLRLQKQTDGSWRLIGIPMGVEGWHSEFESTKIVPQGMSQIQAFIVEIKARLEQPK